MVLLKEYNELIKEIASKIVQKECALFVGAGINDYSSNDLSWYGLISKIKQEFNYKSPELDGQKIFNDDDYGFEVLDDICKQVGKEKVYRYVRELLQNVRLSQDVEKIAAMPWFAVFTTNYDLAFGEKLKEKNQKLEVTTVSIGDRFSLSGMRTRLFIMHLMGTIKASYGQHGHMILDKTDLIQAQIDRPEVWNKLADHAAYISFLFLGYSFRDEIMTEALSHISTTTGKPEHKFYALFKTEPDKKTKYKLKGNKIEIIVGSIDDFCIELANQVSLRNPSDFSTIGIPISNEILHIESKKISKIIQKYQIVTSENLKEEITNQRFLKGNISTLYPFKKNMNFKLNWSETLVEKIVKDKIEILIIEGYPGTGKTYTILDSIYKLIQNHNSIAIKIKNSIQNSLPDANELNQLIETLNSSLEQLDKNPVSRILFWSEKKIPTEIIQRFQQLNHQIDIELNLIIENEFVDDLDYCDFETLRINSTLSTGEKNDLSLYIKNLLKEGKVKSPLEFNDNYETSISELVEREENLFSIFYKIFNPSKDSINTIVEHSYSEIKMDIHKEIINLVALSNAMKINTPISIIQKYIFHYHESVINIDEILRLCRNELNNFLGIDDKDLNKLGEAFIYHFLVGKRIANEIVGKAEMDKYLYKVIRIVNFNSQSEAEYAGEMIITNGFKNYSYEKPFSEHGLITAVEELTNKHPIRPILHHYAKFLAEKKPDELDKINHLLDTALLDNSNTTVLTERKENILTTQVDINWKIKKKDLLSKSFYDSEIQNLLDKLSQARMNCLDNIHPYDVQARIVLDFINETENFDEKFELAEKAIRLLEEGIENIPDYNGGNTVLKKTMIEVLSSVSIEKAEKLAEQYFKEEGNGIGYYVLGNIDYYVKKDIELAKQNYSKSLNASKYPSESVHKLLKICLDEQAPEYSKLSQHLEKDKTIQNTTRWRHLYNYAVIKTINGDYSLAKNVFSKCNRLAPRSNYRKILVFWMENGSRKVFYGTIKPGLESHTGFIELHTVQGIEEPIYFNPNRQKDKSFQNGVQVKFYVGFSPRGPQAFDVEID